MVLSNAYHLSIRPGVEVIEKLGGIHRFMGWNGPILTDSGGFQVFSLASSVKVDEEGAVFRSHLDGAPVRMTPEGVVTLEYRLGVDIGMAFDVCVAEPGNRKAAADGAARTLRWTRRTRSVLDEAAPTAIFAIQQGGLYEDLRREQAQALAELDFPGYAVGGLSVGEEREQTMATAELSVAMLPPEKPRYMMGMGTPLDLVELCGWGYDLFDCVLPTLWDPLDPQCPPRRHGRAPGAGLRLRSLQRFFTRLPSPPREARRDARCHPLQLAQRTLLPTTDERHTRRAGCRGV
jgi:queuine tRNA-ribosyltransferase